MNSKIRKDEFSVSPTEITLGTRIVSVSRISLRARASASKNGRIVIKGPNSYSYSKVVHIEHIKFSIDNQLS